MKRRNNLKTIALVAAFALAGAGAWGQVQAPIASWDVRYGTGSTANEYSIGISMVGATPMVSIKKAGSAYSHFIAGYIVDSVWYVWQAKESALGRTTYDWVAMGSETSVAKMLASIRTDTAKDAADTKTIESQQLQSERFYYSAKVNNFDIQPGVQSTGWVKSYATRLGLGGLVTARLDLLNGRAGGGQIVVALYDEAGLKLDGLAFTWEGEYFDGERAFFAKTSTEKPYHKMVLALLGVYFDSHGAGDFKSVMAQVFKNGVKMETSDWKVFDSVPDKEAYALRAATALGNNLTGFLKSTIHMPAYWPGSSMVDASYRNVFDIDMNGKVGEKISLYDSIYGSHANPYIQAYLYYTFIKNKPVFSAEAARQGALNYDWNQYTQIEPLDGKAIAAAAMRYLAWGVEYLLPSSKYL